MMHSAFRIIPLLLMVCLLVAPGAGAQDVRVFAQIQDEVVYAGAPFTALVVVNGATDSSIPTNAESPGVTLSYVGASPESSSHVSIINGRRTERKILRVIHQFQGRIDQAGQHVIPAFTVDVNGRTLRSNTVPIDVRPAMKEAEYVVDVKLSKTSAYVGEPISATVTWFIRENRPTRAAFWSAPSDDFAYAKAPDPVARADQIVEGVTFDGEPVRGVQGAARLNGETVQAITIERIIIPTQPGSLTLPPFTLDADAEVGRRRAFAFGDRSITERVVVQTAPITLDIRPLPTEGRPASFNGLIGAYTIRAAASPTEVNVGDPIELEVRISGPAPIDIVPDLNLASQPALAHDFRFSSEGVDVSVEGRDKVFRTTVRAKRDDVQSIAPIELGYFDAPRGEYRVAESRPIRLNVRPTRQITIADADGVRPTSMGRTLESVAGGLTPNYTTLAALEPEDRSVRFFLTNPSRIAAVAAPAAIYALAGAIAFARRRDTQTPARRRRQALDAARMLLDESKTSADPAQSSALVSRAICSFIAEAHNQPPSGATRGECVELIQNHNDQLASDLDTLLADCDSMQFAGATHERTDDLHRRAASLLDQLQSELESVE